MNTSQVALELTARTSPVVAQQRAEHLSLLSVKRVLELCVGPSLVVLEQAYRAVGIAAEGNDIDPRWQAYYPQGVWRIGNCLEIDYAGVDAVVFAPPLTRGCTGQRADALMIESVHPTYAAFLIRRRPERCCLVLPGRSLSTRDDRAQFHRLLTLVSALGYNHEAVEMVDGCRKYVDLYCALDRDRHDHIDFGW